jgi:hypothetical protein
MGLIIAATTWAFSPNPAAPIPLSESRFVSDSITPTVWDVGATTEWLCCEDLPLA